jgi:hypothetical protein
MNRHTVNALIVVFAVLIHAALGFLSGSTSVNDGLGWEGPIFAAMITDHDVQRGSAVHRLTPALPLAAAIPFAGTGNLVGSFQAVNIVAFVLLVLATCLILDAHATPLLFKLCAALTVTVLGVPTAATAFNPGQPDLLAVALVLLAVASSEAGGRLQVAVTHVLAALATPIGIIAPLYGISKRWRLRQRTPQAMVVFLPALVTWLLLQAWARGGPRGVLELAQFSRVAADVALWSESRFILYGVYFLITSLGGLTLLLWSRPRWIADAVREKPELLALVVPVAPFIATGGLDVPRMIPFLLPLWLILIGVWCREQKTSLVIPVVLATVLTLWTQHPWAAVNNDSYFIDWFPYSVHAARVNVSAADLGGIWRLRALSVALGLAAFVAWRRSLVPRDSRA